MNRRGISLVELLGAIVVFGLVISITSLFLTVFIDSNQRIADNARANAAGARIIDVLETSVNNLSPTNYTSCGPKSCLVLEKRFAYEFDEVSETIDLITYVPPQTLKLEIDRDNVLLINDSPYSFEGFIINQASSITYQQEDQYLYIVVDLYLENPDGELFNFQFTDAFEVIDVPVE
ncbi:MAG: hypothetical protein JXB20_05860 [Bacilli bacterium]|nr:hypothetical protein [Bacilli bacterium]MBN2696547.1 hypothetical protein [Bacilli bacterium]